MPYDEKLVMLIRQALESFKKVEEKVMFGGICFMVNEKMCIGVMKEEMMCRIDPARKEEALERRGCREMDFNGRVMKGFVLVNEQGMKSKKDFDYWIGLCLEFNPKAKSSKKK